MTIIIVVVHDDGLLQSVLVVWIHYVLPYNDTHNVLQLALHIGRMRLQLLLSDFIQRLADDSDGLAAFVTVNIHVEGLLVRERLPESEHKPISAWRLVVTVLMEGQRSGMAVVVSGYRVFSVENGYSSPCFAQRVTFQGICSKSASDGALNTSEIIGECLGH